MESQLPRSHGHHYDEETPHTAAGLQPVEGEDEHHHEKKSVMKKVKAKAKKIKDTLTKHGHGHEHEHEHEHEHDHDYHDNEGEDEDDEMVEDPEIHGAPMYESAAVRSAVHGADANLGRPAGNLERPSVMAEDRYESKILDPPVRPFAQWEEENRVQESTNLGRPTAREAVHLPEDKNVSFPPQTYGTKPTGGPTGNTGYGQEAKYGQGISPKIGVSKGMEEDPHAPKAQQGSHSSSNYQTKVSDPTGAGGEEAGITSILHYFDKMGVSSGGGGTKTSRGEQNLYTSTGSHDQFAPKVTISSTAGSTDSDPKRFDGSGAEQVPRDTSTGKPSGQGRSYTEKISSATTTIADKAAAAKQAVASKLGYVGANDETRTREVQPGAGEDAKSASPAGYGQKFATTVKDNLAPVYGKVAGAGSAVFSKVQGTGTGQEVGPDKGVSVKEYLSEKLKPGDEDKALSEVISEALHKQSNEPSQEAKPAGSRAVSEVISDAFHKRNEEPDNSAVKKPMGKVAESEEVVKRLGTGDEHNPIGAGSAGPGKGVVDMLKGAVSSWLGGKGGEPSISQGTTHVGIEGLSNSASTGGATGDRRLNEYNN